MLIFRLVLLSGCERFPDSRQSDFSEMFSQRLTFFFGGAVIFVLVVIVLQVLIEEYLYTSSYVSYNGNSPVSFKDVTVPVVLWWTSFTGEKGLFKLCGDVKCFFTDDRAFWHHPMLKVIMFYGSKFDVVDLPLPRNSASVLWALFHEESPKNTPILSHGDALKLFNYTATFSRQSHFPLTLQYLQDIEVLIDNKYFVNLKIKNKLLKDIAPVLYIHSDCDTPLERDSYVKELMNYIPIDSYGACLQNRKLPDSLVDPMESMESEEFFRFVARYKFTLAFENSVCEDYITEKLWRPLIVGSVPVYMGSPSVRDWLPNINSAIIASEYKSPKKLAEFLQRLNDNDTLYETYLEHKYGIITNTQLITALNSRVWGIGDDFEKGNMVEHFECFVCQRASSNQQEVVVGDLTHYNCPSPISPLTGKKNMDNWWLDEWKKGCFEAKVLTNFIDNGVDRYSKNEFYTKVKKLMKDDLC